MNIIRRINDFVLYMCFCFLTGTGLMMKLSFVKGMGRQTVLSLSKHDWEECHMYVGILMFIAMLLHLILNRIWILKVGSANKKWVAITAIAIGIILIGVLIFTPTTIHK